MEEGNGLRFIRARDYDEAIRRFLNGDLMLGDLMRTQSLNRYAYVQDDRLNLIDPSGLTIPVVCRLLAGGAWPLGYYVTITVNGSSP